jgi:hypothetical protein
VRAMVETAASNASDKRRISNLQFQFLVFITYRGRARFIELSQDAYEYQRVWHSSHTYKWRDSSGACPDLMVSNKALTSTLMSANGSKADKPSQAKIHQCPLLSESDHPMVDERGQRVVRRLPPHRLKTFAHGGLDGFYYRCRVAAYTAPDSIARPAPA